MADIKVSAKALQEVADSMQAGAASRQEGQQSGHRYLKISGDKLVASEIGEDKGKISFKEITIIFKTIMDSKNPEINALQKSQALNAYKIIKENFEKKPLGFFTNLFFGEKKKEQVKNAENLIKQYTPQEKVEEKKIVSESVSISVVEEPKKSTNVACCINCIVVESEKKQDLENKKELQIHSPLTNPVKQEVKISIVLLDASTLVIKIDPKEDVEELKERIRPHGGYASITLVLDGMALENDRTLASYDITEEDILYEANNRWNRGQINKGGIGSI